ncbi:MAG: hypothetical protein ACK5JC_06150 [Bacteroidota bacterium]|jgi:pimeloyl-ACP methyl ester carboxylesterase
MNGLVFYWFCLFMVMGLYVSAQERPGVPDFNIHLKTPIGKPRAVLLVFPGYKFGWEEMQKQTEIIRLAEKQNYLVVLPEMGNSLYIDTAFQETIPALKSQRGVAFVNQRLVPLMDSLLEVHHLPLLVYGLSTGCRGALQYAAKQKQTLALALLSGDYCFSLDINDKLARRFLGDYHQHSLRWQETGNLLGLANELLCKVFLACGELDQVARPLQSKALKSKLLPRQSELLIQPGAGHEAGFWRDTDKKVIRFFEKALK